MKKQILLHIPEPCHENWDAMTPQDKGRHCQSCNKVVVDFSVMTDRQVLDYFKNAQGNTCGRFHNDQLQRPLIEPQKQPGKWNYFLASVASFFVGLKLIAQPKVLLGKVANPKQEIVNKATENNAIKGEVAAPKLITVSGKVTDEKGVAIAGASITIDKTNKGVVSDKDGNFSCKAKSIKSIAVRAVNYETKTIEIKNNDSSFFEIQMQTQQNYEIEKLVIQVPYCCIKRTSKACSGEPTMTAKQIEAQKVTSFTKVLDGIVGEVSIINDRVNGKVVDEKGAAITDASIQIKGTKLGTTSKADGSFELNKLGNNTKLTLVVSSLGYETKTIEVESKDLNNNLNIVLKENVPILQQIVLESNLSSHRLIAGGISTYTVVRKRPKLSKAIIKPIQKLLDIEPVKIYPNPVAKNANVHIAIKQTGTWELQLFTVQSNLLSVKEVVINTQNQIIDYTLPNNIVSGNYFLRLVNKETKKVITEKIIVL